MSKPETKNEEIKQLVLTTDPDNVSKELLNKFAGITSLDLSYSDFKNIDILVNLRNLRNLQMSDYGDLQNVDVLTKLTNLISLDLSGCRSLDNVDSLSNLSKLTKLDLSGCDSLQNVNCLANCTNLTSLDLSFCDSLQDIDGLANCTNLTSLALSRCGSLQNADVLSGLTNLTSLDLGWCKSLQNLDVLDKLTNLTSLDLSLCRSLQNVDGLANLPNLTSLDLRWCDSLQNVDVLANLHLEHLSLHGLDFTELFPEFGNLKNMKALDLGYCKNMGDEALGPISKLVNLEELDLWKCKNISDRGLVYLSKNLNLKRLDLIGTRVTDKAVNKLKDKLPGLTILWRLFEQTLSVCKDPGTGPDELERIYNIFMFADYRYEDWITPKTPCQELEYVHLIGLATALAGNPQCPETVLADLFDLPERMEHWEWPDDNHLQLNVLSNPGCPVSVLYDVIRGDNDELKEAAAKSPAVKKLKPAGFGRYADPETGEVIAKMQDGKLVAVEKAE